MGALLGSAALNALVPEDRARAQNSQGGGGGGNSQGGGGGGNSQGGGGGGSCFLRGTRIRTPEGDKEIEQIKIGELVITKSGEAKPVLWVARRRYRRKSGMSWARDIAPVRVARGALGPDTPTTDLFLSDRHALYFEGFLVPVLELINGKSIVRHRAEDLEEIEYLHLQLAAHDVIFAEGAACDSLRAGSIGEFDNSAEYEQLYRRSAPEPACAPILGFVGGRSELASRWRSAISPIFDRRTPLDLIRDELEERAERLQSLRSAA